MSFTQNALNSERIKTQKDIIDVRNAYKTQLQSQININKINRDVNTLFNFNGSLPHYTPSFKTTQEILADKNELKTNTIEYIRETLLADAQHAIGITEFVSTNFSLVQFRQELPRIVKQYLELFSMGITLSVFKETFLQMFPHYKMSSSDEDKDVYTRTYDNDGDDDDDESSENDDDDDDDMEIESDDENKKSKKTRIQFDKGTMKAKSRIPKQNKNTKPKSNTPVFTSTSMPSLPMGSRKNILETERNNRKTREAHDETIYPAEKRNKRDRKRNIDDDTSQPVAKRSRVGSAIVRRNVSSATNEAKDESYSQSYSESVNEAKDNVAVNQVKQKRNMTQAQDNNSHSRYVKRRQTPIDDMTISELKAFANSANIVLPSQVKNGNKALLFAYLNNSIRSNTPPQVPDNDVVRSYGRNSKLTNDFGEKMTINQMKTYAQSKGIQIPTTITRKNDIYNYLNQSGQAQTPPPDFIQYRSQPPSRPSVRKVKQSGKGIQMRGNGMYSTTRDSKEARWYGNDPCTEYKPLGSKLIHHDRLCHEHIVSLSHKCGAKDKNFPARKVNSTFANVLRDIINSKAPNFDELKSLSGDDNKYLHLILKTTKTHGYYSIPMPSKTDDDADFDRFQWCLGQIRAGNNNSDLVKELKLKLMKYRNEKRLPRSQVNDILYQLNDLGY